jgi:PAS domain S-box-containing protein
MEDSPMPTVMLFCDSTGRIVDAHPMNRSDWDLPADGAIQDALDMDFPEIRNLLERTSGEMRPVSDRSGRPVLLQLFPLPAPLAPSGGFLAAVTLPPAPIAEPQAAPSAATASTLDYAVFNAVFHDMEQAILLTDEEFRILAANRKAMELYAGSEDGIEDISLPNILRPSDKVRVLATAHALASGGRWSGRLTTLGAGGQKTPVNVTIRCLNVKDVRLFQFILSDLRKHLALERDLAKSRMQVEDMNTALKQVLRNVEEERQELKDELVQQVREGVLPTIERIVQEDSQLVRQAYRSALEEKIADMVEASSEAESLFALLTPREMDICRLIQQSWQGRAIAEQLGISFETLQTHRKNIRRKLGLKGGPVSLSAFLQQHPPL